MEPEPERGRNGEDSPEAALRQLGQRLEAASEAAERLISDAAAQATASAARMGERLKPPPAGWQIAGQRSERSPGDVEMLLALVDAVADLIPADLRRRLTEALRELLLAVRALIDWYLERSKARAGEPTEVQDIPVE